MNFCAIPFAGETLHALGSGALWWEDARTLIVSDLHLGKSERMARRSGALLPPYEVRETLSRLAADIAAMDPSRVICLGDSLDDCAARDGFEVQAVEAIAEMQAGRNWIWITGNHDPAPVDLGGIAVDEIGIGALTFRHIAAPHGSGEISGHYHPKARLFLSGRAVSRRCFLFDGHRLVMPAYGTYTGGLDWRDPVFRDLFSPDGAAILTGERPCRVPMRPTAAKVRARI